MKKSTVALLLIAFILSSCSTYFCPTYATKDVKKEKDLTELKKERI